MSLPLLIVGGRPEDRLAQIDLTPGPDRLIINPDKSIGIKAVRELQKFLQQKPYLLETKTVIITQAETMTLAAQQAILKTLEEPPAHSQIILLCQQTDLLLDTIVSRCRVQHLAESGLRPGRIEPPGPEAAVNTATAREFVVNQLRYLQSELRRHPETVNVRLIQALNQALTALKFNVNPKLTLDVLSLNY